MPLEIAALIALPGTHVTCPECHAQVATLVKAWRQGFNPGLNTLRFEPGMFPKHGSAHCPKCGGSYAETDTAKHPDGTTSMQMLLHTDYGWLPKPPPDAPPPKKRPVIRLPR